MTFDTLLDLITVLKTYPKVRRIVVESSSKLTVDGSEYRIRREARPELVEAALRRSFRGCKVVLAPGPGCGMVGSRPDRR